MNMLLERNNSKVTSEEFQGVNIKISNVTLFLKRTLDLIISVLSIVLLFPAFILISMWIYFDSGAPVFFRQERMGRGGKRFLIIKFRTMFRDSDKKGCITIHGDPRITKVGKYLRKFRLDEFPQLFNIFLGEMSFVGPRPDVPDYYDLRKKEHQNVLKVRPGITCPATLKYKDEDILLSNSQDPYFLYKHTIFPEKIRMNLDYINKISLKYDLYYIWLTFVQVFIKNKAKWSEFNE